MSNNTFIPILPFLYLGNERDAQDLDLLLRLNIGFVVNVTTHLPLYHQKAGLRYKRLPATDNSKQNLRQYFEEVFEFIGECFFLSGQGVLVHCQAGVSRSATVVIAYLMKHTLMTMTDAYKYVRSRRPVVSPNLNFMGQLLEFERDLNSGVTPRILIETVRHCFIKALLCSGAYGEDLARERHRKLLESSEANVMSCLPVAAHWLNGGDKTHRI
uniref:protein-tyrosine-phosphatase n=1 Tax=Neogobius melanostomus TaxID=47308 RepID=A0A8C6UKG9_9GOBI